MPSLCFLIFGFSIFFLLRILLLSFHLRYPGTWRRSQCASLPPPFFYTSSKQNLVLGRRRTVGMTAADLSREGQMCFNPIITLTIRPVAYVAHQIDPLYPRKYQVFFLKIFKLSKGGKLGKVEIIKNAHKLSVKVKRLFRSGGYRWRGERIQK